MTSNRGQRHFEFVPYDPPRTQAERILNAFGGARALSRALESVGVTRNPASIFRWTYPKDSRGLGGRVPTQVWPALFKAADQLKITITPEMMDPREKVPQEEADVFS